MPKLLLSSKHQTTVLTLLLFFTAFVGIIALAQHLADNQQATTVVEQFGYVGVVILGVIAGLNAFFPVPAATLTPLYVGAGLTLPLIVLSLTVGTMIADFVGFFIGRLSRELIAERYPKTMRFFANIRDNRSHLIIPAVVLYAAFVPFPNEAILLPLGLTGFRFGTLIIPLFIGNLIHQALLVYGVNGLSAVFF